VCRAAKCGRRLSPIVSVSELKRIRAICRNKNTGRLEASGSQMAPDRKYPFLSTKLACMVVAKGDFNKTKLKKIGQSAGKHLVAPTSSGGKGPKINDLSDGRPMKEWSMQAPQDFR
jgi:hypothetical protein